MSFPWIAYSVELLDVWQVHISPIQYIWMFSASKPYVPFFHSSIFFKYTWFGDIVYLNRNHSRQNYSFAEMYPFSYISASRLKQLALEALSLVCCCHNYAFENSWVHLMIPVVHMSLEQHAGSLQSPGTLSTLQSGLGELFPRTLLAKPHSSGRKQIAFLMESST